MLIWHSQNELNSLDMNDNDTRGHLPEAATETEAAVMIDFNKFPVQHIECLTQVIRQHHNYSNKIALIDQTLTAFAIYVYRACQMIDRCRTWQPNNLEQLEHLIYPFTKGIGRRTAIELRSVADLSKPLEPLLYDDLEHAIAQDWKLQMERTYENNVHIDDALKTFFGSLEGVTRQVDTHSIEKIPPRRLLFDL